MKKILIVDDEKMIANVLARVLNKEEQTTTLFNSGIEALQHLQELHKTSQFYDLILMDLLMPEVSGADILNWIHTNTPRTKVIMMTAYGDSNIRTELLQRGASIVLQKPFENILDIPKIVSEILR